MGVTYKDYYEALGVKRDASADEIRRAYRRRARKYHPDVSKEPGAQQKFSEISEAHDVLKDPQKRKRYDALGADWKSGQEFRPPPGWQNTHFEFRGGPGQRGFSFSQGGFSDFFDAMFGSSADAKGGPRGGFGNFDFANVRPGQSRRDVQGELTVSVEEVFHGGTRRIRLSQQASKSVDVKIPAGVKEGSKIRLKGQGEQGGDLILAVQIAPHPRFTVDGSDVATDLRLAPWEAALGAKIPVATLDGEVTLSIPPGTSTGGRLRLRGKGLPKRGGERGDMFARVQIVVPKSVSDAERGLYEQLKEQSKFAPRDDE